MSPLPPSSPSLLWECLLFLEALEHESNAWWTFRTFLIFFLVGEGEGGVLNIFFGAAISTKNVPPPKEDEGDDEIVASTWRTSDSL